MQTFLPYADFSECARVLDTKRLNKQLVECQQILNTLTGRSKGWQHHPAVKMWRGYEPVLAWDYSLAIFQELYVRSKDIHYSHASWSAIVKMDDTPLIELEVPWLGIEKLHASHRANLLRKDPEHYGKFGWTEEPAEGYWWPTKEGF